MTRTVRSTSKVILERLQGRKIIPITLDQISRLSPPRSQLPIAQLASQSSQFLQDQVPIRLLHRHFAFERFLHHISPSEGHSGGTNKYQWLVEPVQNLSSFLLETCEQLVLLQEEEAMKSTDKDQQGQRLVEQLEHVRTRLDERLEAMMQSLHYKTTTAALSGRTIAIPQHELDHVLDGMHRTMISLRVLITQFSLLHQQLSTGASASATMDSVPSSIVNPKTNLIHLIKCVSEDTQAMCVEKLGESPNVETHVLPSATATTGTTSQSPDMVSVESHIYFIMMELLKNAMRAVLDQQNRTGIENSTPIHVHVAQSSQQISIRVSDSGGGLKNTQQCHSIFDYFHSTAPKFEPTYTYSGNFGAPFTGLGCGLPIARQYARYYGGDLQFVTMPGYGSDVYLFLNRNGATRDEN